MDKLKKGWINIVLVSLLTSLILSYLVIAQIYTILINEKLELFDALLMPLDIYEYMVADENLKMIIPFIPLGLLFGVLYLLRKSIFDLKYDDASEFGVKGTAKWGNVNTAYNGKLLSSKNNFSNKNFKKGLKMEEGTIIGKVPNKNKALIIHEKSSLDNKNVFVSGSSGSGKGQSYILSNLVNIKTEGIIVIDPKGENYEYTHQLKRDQGYKVYNIDFANFSESRYNPLDYVMNDEDAKKISEMIVANSSDDVKFDFFTSRAQALLSALISYVKSEYPKEEANMEKVISVYNEHVSDIEECDIWMNSMPDNHPAKGLLLGVLEKMKSPNTRSSVLSSFDDAIDIFQLSRVKEMTRVSDFMFDDFQKEKSIVYVKISVPTNPYKSLTSVFFVQMIDRFFDLGDLDPLGRLKIPINFLLDEAPNIGKIMGYQETLALCRGYRMYMHTIIQDISQFEQKSMYGKETTRSIVSNHSTKLILKVGEPETAAYWSKWFSDTTVSYKKKSESIGKSGRTTNHDTVYENKKLLPENELMQMDDNEAYLLMTGEHPLKIEKAWQFHVFPNLLSNKNRELIYNKVRDRLGFTDDIYETNKSVKNINVFEEYQNEKLTNDIRNIAVGTFDSIISQAKLNENDINEINHHRVKEENKVDSSTFEEVENVVNEHLSIGSELYDTNINTDDLLNAL